MLVYVTSWKEKGIRLLDVDEPPYSEDAVVRRCWKGFDFDVLNKLEEQGRISQSKRAKSLYLTDEGEQEARELLVRHGFASGTD